MLATALSHRLQLQTNRHPVRSVTEATTRQQVFIIGYDDSPPRPQVTNDPRIEVVPMHLPFFVESSRPLLLSLGAFGFFFFASLKVFFAAISLLRALTAIPDLRLVLVQSPPAFPTLPVAHLVARLRSAEFVVDWHNYGYSLLRLARAPPVAVHISRFLERYYGGLSDWSLCVSRAMEKNLVCHWRLKNVFLLYDRPPEFMRPITLLERHETMLRYFKDLNTEECCAANAEPSAPSKPSLLQRLQEDARGPALRSIPRSHCCCEIRSQVSVLLPAGDHALFGEDEAGVRWKESQHGGRFTAAESTPFTALRVVWEKDVGTTPPRQARDGANAVLVSLSCKAKPDRPAMVMTSTSWTPDEDLGLLLNALSIYDKTVCHCRSQSRQGSELEGVLDLNGYGDLPPILVVISGRGPLKEKWMKEAAKRDFKFVKIRALFVPTQEYPRLLACSDIGVSLHMSSSGLDLPMKVVDMLGVGLPVLAYRYAALNELVKEGTALTFSDEVELAMRLAEVLQGFPSTYDCQCGATDVPLPRRCSSVPSPLFNLRSTTESQKPPTWEAEWTLRARTLFFPETA
eukprot:Polyplicarium_translucidae@DN2569_c0_g1_i2.p2